MRLQLDLIKGKRMPVDADREAGVASSPVHADRPLEVAVETATIHLMDWLITDYGFTPTDAYCLVSTCPDFRINVYQMCKIGKLSYVAGAEIPKKYLGGGVVIPATLVGENSLQPFLSVGNLSR